VQLIDRQLKTWLKHNQKAKTKEQETASQNQA